VGEDERLGRPSSDSHSDSISGYLNRNPQASCPKIAKELFIPMTTILAILNKVSLRFFVARQMPYRLLLELKAKRIEICQKMLEVLEQLGP
jgi:hypothetical protein